MTQKSKMGSITSLTVVLFLALFAAVFAESLDTVEHTKVKYGVCYKDSRKTLKALKKICPYKYIKYCPFKTNKYVCKYRWGRKTCYYKVVAGLTCKFYEPYPTPSTTPTATPTPTSTATASPSPKPVCKPIKFTGGYGRKVYKIDAAYLAGKIPFYYVLEGKIKVKVVYGRKTIFKLSQRRGKIAKSGVAYFTPKSIKKVKIIFEGLKYDSKWVFVVKCPYY